MRILILDDMPERHEGFKVLLKGHDLVHAYTYTDAVESARFKSPFDMMCLDHDLDDGFEAMKTADWYEGGGMYVGNKTYYNGQDFCWRLHQFPEFCAPKVLIHSWNDTGGKAMEAILRSIPRDIEITRKPFRAPA